MPVPHPQYVAGGNIYGNRFIMIGSAMLSAIQATANAVTLGISRSGAKYPPSPEISNTYLCESGDPVPAFGNTDEALLLLADTVAVGGLIKSDGDGKGVPVLTSGTTIQQIGARALQAGVSGDLIRVEVFQSSVRPALT